MIIDLTVGVPTSDWITQIVLDNELWIVLCPGIGVENSSKLLHWSIA